MTGLVGWAGRVVEGGGNGWWEKWIPGQARNDVVGDGWKPMNGYDGPRISREYKELSEDKGGGSVGPAGLDIEVGRVSRNA